MMKQSPIFLWLPGTIVLILALFLVWASGGRGDPSLVKISAPEHLGIPSADKSAKKDKLGIVTWNIAYGRGVEGDSSGPWPRSHIIRHLNEIASAIKVMEVDIAALQEVDLASARSHHIHQGRYIAEALGWSHLACVETWVQNYIPFPYWPPTRHYGAMRSGQCVLSRFPILKNHRYRLAQPRSNPSWYNLFYLHRAIQLVEVDFLGEKLKVYNIHLEAFDAPNRQRQIQHLLDLLGPQAPSRSFVLGDFNALPPEATRRHDFPDDPRDDYRDDKTMDKILVRSGLFEVLRVSQGENLEPNLTFPADRPSRRLDYLFFGRGFVADEGLIPNVGNLSDHLPVFGRFLL